MFMEAFLLVVFRMQAESRLHGHGRRVRDALQHRLSKLPFDPGRTRAVALTLSWDRIRGRPHMAWYNLFTTDYGLMSLGVIVGVIVIGAYLFKKFNDLSRRPPGEQQDW
jgi:hypothetical protein